MMIDDAAINIVQNILNSYPRTEWIDAAKKALPAVEEDDIIEMIMFLNVGDVIELEE
jgi:uncharacterized protein (DUF1499 family)